MLHALLTSELAACTLWGRHAPEGLQQLPPEACAAQPSRIGSHSICRQSKQCTKMLRNVCPHSTGA